MPRYWLLKSEPESFSIDHLAQQPGKKTDWTGVRNFQARNFMRDEMKKGDLCFFYHSSAEPTAVMGTVEITQESHPDPTQFDKKSDYFEPRATKETPVWFLVEVHLKEKFKKPVTLSEIKKTKGLEKMVLVQKGSRLSIQPVSANEWEIICGLGR